MNSLIAAAIAPGLAICIYIYWKDKFDREPKRFLIYSFFLGMLSTIPAFVLEAAVKNSLFEIRHGSYFWTLIACVYIGLAEEGSKYFFVRRFAYRNGSFNEPFDGITYSVMVAMGFATVENIFYVLEGGLQTAFFRAFLAVPAHAVNGVIIGFYLGRQKMLGVKNAGITGLLLASGLHAAYDFFLMINNNSGLWSGAVLALILGLRFSLKAIRSHQEASPFRS